MKLRNYIISLAVAGTLAGVAVSCDDMLDKGNDYTIDLHSLTNPSDTTTYLLGIINKLQGIAVRNNLFGEVRGDLVSITSNATSDLKDLADFNVSDDNMYNVPRDYYAVINNCNNFLANADSTAGNASRNEKYFVNEIAQVHSIRAWTYLQLVLAYGSVPLVTDPVLTKKQSEASYPMADLVGICDYFINDLQPYYATEYPDPENIGGDIDPRLCFFPTQVVTGDLYLWLAAATQDKEAAKNAAKCYYDYIVWDLGGKDNLYTLATRWYWDDNSIEYGRYMMPSSEGLPSSEVWGNANCDDITKIPMDSAAADGYYNELRNLYNTTNVIDVVQKSITPSEYLKELSASQLYVTEDKNGNITEITSDLLTDEALENNYAGDLRFQKDYSTRTERNGSSAEEYEAQTINKHNSQHISVYRITQLYLRLAEALNYAGYPRFAKQILTMGLSNNVIDYEVSPYYPTAADSAFISYFQFSNTSFLPYATNYSQTTISYGVENVYSRVTATEPVPRSGDWNMWGVHSRGSGLAFRNEKYAPSLLDSVATGYPFALEEAIPEKPTEPAEVKAPGTFLTYEEWVATTTQSNKSEDRYQTSYVDRYNDSVANYAQYQEDMKVYRADVATYDDAVETFINAFNSWYGTAYAAVIPQEQKQIDELILTEQALELSYEGNRFYDLMRRAYWWNDNSYLTGMQGKDNAGKLASRSNWFIKWDGQIGLYDDEEEEEPATED